MYFTRREKGRLMYFTRREKGQLCISQGKKDSYVEEASDIPSNASFAVYRIVQNWIARTAKRWLLASKSSAAWNQTPP